MKRFTSLLVAVFLITTLFSSCILRDDSSSNVSGTTGENEASTTGMIKNIVTEDATEEEPSSSAGGGAIISDTEPSVTYPVGFYIGNDQTCEYTFVNELKAEFPGKDKDGAYGDIANLGIMPSTEAKLSGDKYPALWLSAAEKAGIQMSASNVNFKLSIKLKSGETKSYEIKSPDDAAKVGKDEYVSVLLFDDIHQVEGVKYAALSGESYNEGIMVTTVKLVSNAKSSEVDNIILSAEAVTTESAVSAGIATIRITNSK